MAMALYPQVQKKAQDELDMVLGGALPTFSDQGSLPYTTALVKEVFRWMPVTPLGAHVRSPRRSPLLSGICSVATLYGS